MRLHALLARLTLREDAAEDLLQELAMKLAQSDGFSQAGQPLAYAKRTAINLAMDWRRQQARDAGRARAMRYMPVPHTASPVDALLRNEQLEQLLDQLAELDERDRWMISRRHLNGCSYAELAAEMGCTAHQARGLCHKAVRRLRERLNDTAASRLPRKEAHQ